MKTQVNAFPNSGCITILVLLLFFTVSTSCTQEDIQKNVSGKETKEVTLKMSVDEANAIKIKKTGSFIIPESEAIEMVRQRYMNDLLTKSGNDYIIKSCKKVFLPIMQVKGSIDETPGYYVVEFLSEGKEGFSMVSGYNLETKRGHTWVIDSRRRSSYKTYDKYEKDDGYDIWRIYVEKREESGPLSVHCNWGWGGTSDGWFISGSFYKYNSFDYRNKLEMTNIQPKN